ncbi:MAG: LamB/YcsF family protein, partial [Actinomycetota bacterium]
MTHLSDSTAGRRIDVNCDIGETSLPWHTSPEPELLTLISSANVACGGHAGDAESMRAVCAA